MTAADPDRVLLVRLGAVGDVVRTLPALRWIRRTWPAARIGWAVERGPAPLLRGHPDLDELLVFDRPRPAWRAAGPARAFLRQVAGFAPALSLDFQASFKSGLVAWWSGAATRAGFDRAAGREASHLFANLRVPLPDPRVHRVERALALARAAGARPGPVEADLALLPAEVESGRALVAAHAGGRTAVALSPFSSRRQAWKRYPLERWAEVARGLAGSGCHVLVLGGPGEEVDARELCARAGAGACAATDLGLRELAAVLGAVDLAVSGDTGPMHLASAAGTPVVAIYGPTDPVLNAPYGAGHVVLAPARPTGRGDADRFPGITPELIVRRALERLSGATAPRHVGRPT
ncbi:MAG: glycosyltransferase family 9 protein [Acidobacteria bacterium]|nr:glycosyltransferase family 9 protein [Acidobacteriota bacterium]